MGYSCTQDASYMLGVISHMFATDGNPNVLTIRGRQYFFERGREQADGAITGSLFKMLPNDMAQRAGRVRIEADGRINAFPAMSVQDCREALATFQDMTARNPSKLREWSIGRI